MACCEMMMLQVAHVVKLCDKVLWNVDINGGLSNSIIPQTAAENASGFLKLSF